MQLIGRMQLFTAATSLGGVESLIEHRKSVEGEASLTPDNLLRISVGIEHIDDLLADWQQALKH
jgi:cystathionine gamma-synthase